MNLFQELKRRKVFKTVGVYAAVALIIIQVADIVFPRLLLPDWTVTFVIVLVIIGFPITFFLSWNYDLKKEGFIHDKSDVEGLATDKRWSLTKKIIFPVTGFILMIIGGLFWFVYPFLTIGMSHDREYDASIAILYMENMSSDENSYFADGLTEELINRLSRIQNLKVTPRTDVAVFKNKSLSLNEFAEKLNVNYIVEGSVRIAGDDLRVNVQLFDIAQENTVWSDSYNNKLKDIFSVQDEIASSIVSKLNEKLTISSSDLIATNRKTTDNLKAYNLYSQAALSMSETNIDGSLLAKRTIPLLEEAIELDSTYADAYALLGLIQFFSTTNKMGDSSNISVMEESILNAETSLLYDPDNELGNASMVFLPMMRLTQYDYYKDNKFFKARNIAIKADKLINKFPDSPLSHLIMGYFYWNRNKIIKDDNNSILALEHMLKVIEITKNQALTKDPLHKPILDQALQDVPSIYTEIGQGENAVKFISNNKKYYCGDGTFECLGVWTLNQIITTFYQSYYYKEALEAINIILARTDEELINTGHGIQSKTTTLFMSGLIHMKWGEYDKAINNFEECLEITKVLERANVTFDEELLMHRIGLNHYYNGNMKVANEILLEGIEIWNINNINTENIIWDGLGQLNVLCGLTSLMNGNIEKAKTTISKVESQLDDMEMKLEQKNEYFIYYYLYLYYNELNQSSKAFKNLETAYNNIDKKQIDQYNNHPEKDTHPRFFYCRDIITAYESNLNQ
ncbi:hypothetical protein EB821_05670 [Candidatus Marinimicrobia bacterium PRS2]|nr:hypothetical protein EB821_05670 [Candidatus Marinimicrobia bacterium PRS2]